MENYAESQCETRCGDGFPVSRLGIVLGPFTGSSGTSRQGLPDTHIYLDANLALKEQILGKMGTWDGTKTGRYYDDERPNPNSTNRPGNFSHCPELCRDAFGFSAISALPVANALRSADFQLPLNCWETSASGTRRSNP
jgi:hypothetical protein